MSSCEHEKIDGQCFECGLDLVELAEQHTTPAPELPRRKQNPSGLEFRRVTLVGMCNLLYATGMYTIDDISDYLFKKGYHDVSPDWVRISLKKAKDHWIENWNLAREEIAQLESFKLSNLEAMVMDSTMDDETKVRLFLQIARRRHSILGLDKRRVEVTGANGGPIQVQHMTEEQIMRELQVIDAEERKLLAEEAGDGHRD